MSKPKPTTKPRLGRPRDAAADRRILDAAFELVGKQGYSGFSIDEIARRTSISKATIYRRWQSGGELLLDVLLDFGARQFPTPQGGGLEDALSTYFTGIFAALNGRIGEVLRALMAEAQAHESFRELFRERFITSRRAPVLELLRAAQRRGELARSADLEALADFIFGALWYRLLIGHARLDSRLISALVDLIRRYK